ncbi:MAG TPA: HAD family phosphatase [Arachnia sp.]|nr:HAD family phosphatase [Arachnia sp.]HMT87566.1 HAD family phosphatase [Arachnia sp.]
MSTVIFDIGQVIIRWVPQRAFEQVLPHDEVEAVMRRIGFAEWNQANDSRADISEAVEDLVRRFPDDETAIRAYREHFGTTITELEPGTGDVIAELQQAGVDLGAITNWSADTFQVALEMHDVLGRFREIVVSGAEGVVKPRPEIFLLACERLGVAPSDAVFVDDSPVNVAGAEAIGMRAIHFRSATQLREELVALGLLGDHAN